MSRHPLCLADADVLRSSSLPIHPHRRAQRLGYHIGTQQAHKIRRKNKTKFTNKSTKMKLCFIIYISFSFYFRCNFLLLHSVFLIILNNLSILLIVWRCLLYFPVVDTLLLTWYVHCAVVAIDYYVCYYKNEKCVCVCVSLQSHLESMQPIYELFSE